MSRTRIVTLPAINRSVTLAAWWPCLGQENMRRFRASMHDWINQRIPYRLRGAEL